MADNYLEKRMADYRAGRLGRPAQRSGGKPAAHSPAVHLCGLPGLVKPLRALGAAVSFSGVDAAEGAALAQDSGSTFCPMPLSEAIEAATRRRGRSLDAVVAAEASEGVTIVVGPSAPAGIHLLDAGLPPEALAPLIVALSKILKPVAVSSRG